ARKASLHPRLPSAARLAGCKRGFNSTDALEVAMAGQLYTAYSCADAEPTNRKFKCTLPTVMRS
ncbi:MAG: hypothetical protein ACRD6N_05440, partial [Pyrinomonadaceae bacterium]